MTGNIQQSEDIVAEVFEKMIFSPRAFTTLPRLKSFLYQSVYNASINYIVAQKRHSRVHEQIRHLSSCEQYDHEIIQNEIMRAELLHEIYIAMEKLPEKCGQIFKMIFVDELSTSEIAGKLQINVQTVRTQKARAIELIKNNLTRKNLQYPLISYMALVITLSK